MLGDTLSIFNMIRSMNTLVNTYASRFDHMRHHADSDRV